MKTKTLADELKIFAPAIALTKFASRDLLFVLRLISFLLLLLSAISVLITLIAFEYYFKLSVGFFMIFLSIWLSQMLIFSYHNYFYFRRLVSIIKFDSDKHEHIGATYDVADVVIKNDEDVTAAFCKSRFGSNILLRTGINSQAIADFLKQHRKKISADMVIMPEEEIFSLIGLGKYLLTHDAAFKNLILKSGSTEDIFLGTLRWIIQNHHKMKQKQRWWGKDNLSKTTGIGRDWAYGITALLEKYTKSIKSGTVFSDTSINSDFLEKNLEELETALIRDNAANAIIIGEAGVGKTDLIASLEKKIKLGNTVNLLSGKKIILLDTVRLLASNNNKQVLEKTLIKMLDQALKAGNIIIAIENMSSFIKNAETIGVFIPEILDPYLASPELQFIVTDTPGAYHNYLETLGAFNRRFYEILIDDSDLTATVQILEQVALKNETKYKTIFTYKAIKTIVEVADQYITNGIMPDKAVKLLIDVAGTAKQKNIAIIDNDLVYEVAEKQTHMPIGPVKSEKEKDLLLHLEDYLHQIVIGQDKAVKAIAKTMRRSRAGIQAKNKPIGSFLFLGPTGVGKTQTAKALAQIFFGAPENMQRLDMSEYSGHDSLQRLIGDGVKPGRLSSLLKEHPYCVLLLDEFEKANQSVHDLFLQILDEGVFTDARGDKINARNTIIIATSNAGSQLIIDTVEQRRQLDSLEHEIVGNIIEKGIFRPELINRFDNTIIFEPLTKSEQLQIANLLTNNLHERLRLKGYRIQIDRSLLDLLVEKGYQPEFGVRPMKRVLQNMVEEKIAQKIITGELTPGSEITLKKSDFENDG